MTGDVIFKNFDGFMLCLRYFQCCYDLQCREKKRVGGLFNVAQEKGGREGKREGWREGGREGADSRDGREVPV